MNMCSNNCNYNNVSSCNNPNTSNVGFVMENGNTAVLTNNTNPYNNDVLNANVNLDNFNSNGILNTNNSCSYNGNNSCNCNTNSCGCSNETCNCNNTIIAL